MPANRKIVYADFTGGLNNRLEPHLIAPNEAQTAQNCTLESGVLRPLNDVSAAVTNSGGGVPPDQVSNFLTYAAGTFFISSADFGGVAVETRYALTDGNQTYITRQGRAPLCITPAGAQLLGVPPPLLLTAVLSAGGATGLNFGTYKYRLTYETTNGLQSNSAEEVVVYNATDTTAQVVLSMGASVRVFDSRVAFLNIYRTKAGESIFYLVAKLDANTSAYTDIVPDTDLDTLNQLTWFAGGTGELTDHAIAPPLTCLSNSLHSRNASGVAGGGIIFGAVGSTAYWSMTGYPHYWPLVNVFPFPDTVESIISWQGVTFFFTATSVYQADGDTDDHISIQKTKAAFGVSPGLGRLTKLTPYGVVFLAREGLALFDGQDTRIISAKKLSRSFLQGLSFTTGAADFFDGRYYLFHSTGTLRFDLRDGVDNMAVTTTTHTVRASCVGNFRDPIIADGSVSPLLGYVSSVQITEGGKYDNVALPTITFTGGVSAGGVGGAVAAVTVSVHSCNVSAGGTGYTWVPEIQFSNSPVDGGTAKGYATVAGGKVTAVILTDPGYGYGFNAGALPTITVSGGGGTGATVAVLYTISGADVTTAGSGYSFSPTISFTAPTTASYTRATGTCIVTPFKTILCGTASDGTSQFFKMGGLVRNPLTGAFDVTDRNERYDETTSTWVTRTAIPAARFNFTPVYLGGFIYVLGGAYTTAAFFTAADTTMRRFNVGANSWSNMAAAPVGLCGYAATTNGTDIFYYGGTDSSATASAVFYRYNVAADTWSNLGSGADARHGCSMAWNTTAGQGYVFGGGPQSGGTAAASSTIIIVNGTGVVGTDTTGNTNGWVGKYFGATINNGGTNYLWTLGGVEGYGSVAPPALVGTTTDTFTAIRSGYGSDLWQYDPNTSPYWSNNVGEVVGVGGRAMMGYAGIGSNMYVIGGATKDSPMTADFFRIDLDSLADNNRTPGLYVIRASDSGNIRRFEGGGAMAVTWLGKEETPETPGPQMTWMRMRVDSDEAVTFSTRRDGAAAVSQKVLSNTTRGTSRFWLTSGTNKPRGQRLALQITSSAGVALEVHRVEIDVKEDAPEERQ